LSERGGLCGCFAALLQAIRWSIQRVDQCRRLDIDRNPEQRPPETPFESAPVPRRA
jgi:hypothetical protein